MTIAQPAVRPHLAGACSPSPVSRSRHRDPPRRRSLELDITQGNIQPMPIAIPAFVATGGDAQLSRHRGGDHRRSQRSGLFAPLDPARLHADAAPPNATPNFANWRGAQRAGAGHRQRRRAGDGRISAEFRLWDVFAGQQLAGKQFFAGPTTGGGSPTSSPTRSTSG